MATKQEHSTTGNNVMKYKTGNSLFSYVKFVAQLIGFMLVGGVIGAFFVVVWEELLKAVIKTFAETPFIVENASYITFSAACFLFIAIAGIITYLIVSRELKG